jgi:unsaturated chondroitin disaccharide hydrolase
MCALFDITGEENWRRDALRAADTLLSRLRPAGRYLQAFGALDDERSYGTSTIDTMMNLPLLWWATRVSGRPEYAAAAVSHADATLRAIVRPDGSTYHLVRYDRTGDVCWRGTYQGADDASCWTRGQAWAVHGFVTAARETGLPRFVEAAQQVLDYYWDRHDPEHLPPYDLTKDTGIVDASAAAIVASALTEALAQPSLAMALDARNRANTLLRVLGEESLFQNQVGLLGHATYSLPHSLGVDGALPYGDYYYVRALRLLDAVEAEAT